MSPTEAFEQGSGLSMSWTNHIVLLILGVAVLAITAVILVGLISKLSKHPHDRAMLVKVTIMKIALVTGSLFFLGVTMYWWL